MSSRTVLVAVPVPGLPALTYRVPKHFEIPQPGCRVLVPVGTRTLTGWVIPSGSSPSAAGAAKEGNLRDLLDVLDSEPLLPREIVDLALWTAEYYAAGPGEALATAMPPQSAVFSRRAARLTDLGRANELQVGPRRKVLDLLREHAALTLDSLARRMKGDRDAKGAVDGLLRDGLIELTQPLAGRRSAFRSVARVRLTALAEDSGAGRGKRQGALLDLLRGRPDGLTARELAAYGIGWDVARRLTATGLAQIDQLRIDRDPFAAIGDSPHFSGERVKNGDCPQLPRALTYEQTAAVGALLPLLEAKAFAVALVHGVTGSGKTEVYLRVAARTLEQGRRVLILVPEIALTPAAAAIFRAAFGDRIAIQHSALSDGERHDQWHRIRRGEIDVVVGTRSAVFAPLPDVGLIVVDEEHDGSFKQDESPRYHGRDVAVVRGRSAGALVVLGSATPALETYENTRQDRYRLVTMTRRVLDRPLARMQVVDMRQEFAERGADIVFSRPLEEALRAHIERGEQAVVLLNRRGFATLMFCRQCGHSLECPNCSLSLTIHRAIGRARCHYCNHAAPLPARCEKCGGEFLEQSGFGTERVEAELRGLMPDARVTRVDRDTVRRRGAISGVLTAMAARKIDVLVGTQMIAKGHDFPEVTLVGVVSADVGLGMPDFRAGERTFQLLTQVSGRAGRGNKPGLAIVQTLVPDHYSIQHALGQDYVAFFEDEMTFRRSMRYPPVVSLINVVVRGPAAGDAMDLAADLAKRLRQHQSGDIRVLGPAPAPLARIKGEHRAQFFIKGTARSRMREALRAAIEARPDARRRISVDVDPLSVL